MRFVGILNHHTITPNPNANFAQYWPLLRTMRCTESKQQKKIEFFNSERVKTLPPKSSEILYLVTTHWCHARQRLLSTNRALCLILTAFNPDFDRLQTSGHLA